MKAWTKDGREWQTNCSVEILEVICEGVRRGFCKAQIRLTQGAFVHYADAATLDLGRTVRENIIDVDIRSRHSTGTN